MTKKSKKVFRADNIASEDIERAVKILARVVSLYGDVYLPLFNRLHEELVIDRNNRASKKLALTLALQYSKEE